MGSIFSNPPDGPDPKKLEREERERRRRRAENLNAVANQRRGRESLQAPARSNPGIRVPD